MKALRKLPDESIDMQITSPPYWGLRDYGEGTESIWDGDENCEHEFENVTYRIGNRAGNKDKDTNPTFMVRNNFKEQFKATEPTTAFCLKCGAWKGQLGLEPNFNLYIKHLADIFDEVKRVLKDDGTCWVNLGDTYFGGNLGVGQPKDWKSISTDNKRTGFGTEQMKDFVKQRKQMEYKSKCLCAIPERFMIEMISRGWILRNKIIWFKRNHMPSSVKDRFANSWEYLFFFSKSKKYYFDLDAIREPHKTESIKRTKHKWEGHREPRSSYSGVDIKKMCHPKGKNPGDTIQPKIKNYSKYETGFEGGRIMKKAPNPNQPNAFHPLGKNPSDTWRNNLREDERAKQSREQEMNTFYSHSKRLKSKFKHANDFWDITTGGYKEAHFAVFPKQLVEKPIKITPKQICKKCGKPVIKKIVGGKSNAFNIRVRDVKKGKIKHKDRKASNKEIKDYNEKNYTSEEKEIIEKCDCHVGFKPAVVLDIFAGSGTSLEVARDLGRDAVGIEIKEDYCRLIEKRLFKENKPLFDEEFKIIN